jgi:hypothetical protein
MDIDETNLINRLKQDDEKAFNILFYQHHANGLIYKDEVT